MATRKQQQRFTFSKSISPTPMTQAEWEASENLLARMVTWAIAVDNPE